MYMVECFTEIDQLQSTKELAVVCDFVDRMEDGYQGMGSGCTFFTSILRSVNSSTDFVDRLHLVVFSELGHDRG